MDLFVLTENIKKCARSLGFSSVGIAKAEPLLPEGDLLSWWLSRKMQGEMEWMARDQTLRTDPKTLLEGAQSVICVAMNYFYPDGKDVQGAEKMDKMDKKDKTNKRRGRISSYAWGDDYHDVLRKRLYNLLEEMKEMAPHVRGRVCVDSAPVMEKSLAVRAGLGWIGKHTNLILPKKGSWFFLGEVIVDIPLAYDSPVADRCGSCTRCLDACPTSAFPDPYLLDARRCISYLTIEHRGEISKNLAEKMESWIFGCDICQEVCPWNRFATPSEEKAFAPRPENFFPMLDSFFDLKEEEFRKRFRKSPIKRAKLEGFQRNVKIARKNF